MGVRQLFRVAGWLLPPLLALLFFVKGQRFDPAVFKPPGALLDALPIPSQAGGWTIEDATAFPADRMYEKINGKAGFYLQYGAVALYSGEWGSDNQRWDMYLYRFKDAPGATGALAGERPANGAPLKQLNGYTVPGQVAAAAGPFYLQLNAQTPCADPAPAVTLAAALIGRFDNGASLTHPAAEAFEHAPAAVAGDLQVSGSKSLVPESAFGFAALNNVQTIQVILDGTKAVWFAAPGDEAVLADYAAELKLYGGDMRFEHEGATGGRMFGHWEIVGVVDGKIWGVHAAPSRDALLRHWTHLLAARQEDGS